MKIKKLCALVLSCAVTATAGALLAACGDGEGDNGGNGAYYEDTRIWYAVGNDAKGTMKVNNWQPETVNDELRFVRDTSVKEENVFTLTLDIYAGDLSTGYAFKFLYKYSEDETFSSVNDELWPRQIGIHNIEGVEGEEGDAVYKIDGETVFVTTTGQDANNIALVKGNEGRYEFTLKTFVDKNGNDTKAPVITVNKLSSFSITHDMYIRGDIDNFGLSKTYPMTEVIDGSTTIWRTQFEVKGTGVTPDTIRDETGAMVDIDEVGTYAAIHIYNEKDKMAYVSDDYLTAEIDVKNYDATVNKFMLLPAGKYTVEYNQTTNKVTVHEGWYEMHFIGSFNSWNESDSTYKMTESTDGKTWTGTIVLDKAETLKLYNKFTDTYYTTAELGEADIALEAGTYNFTFTISDFKVAYTKVS